MITEQQTLQQTISNLKDNQQMKENLSLLRTLIGTEDDREYVLEALDDGSLEAWFSHEEPKVRKNAASLAGDLEMFSAKRALFQAYQAEDKRFVRSTQLKALRKLEPEEFLDELKNLYEEKKNLVVGDEDRKHHAQELRALEQILQEYGVISGETPSHEFIGWKEKMVVLLTTLKGYEEITGSQVEATRKTVTSLGVKAQIEDLSQVISIRTFRELLFPIALKTEITIKDGPKKLGDAIAVSGLLPFLKRCHRGEQRYGFRLEMRGKLLEEQKNDWMKRVALAIETGSERQLINRPEDYEFELRLLANSDEKIFLFLKMNTIPMNRFAYRKETIPMSMHPSTAATLMKLAEPYMKENAQILDPVCGVATLLAERHKVRKAREIYGIDIYGEAIDKAKINMHLAGMKVNFIHRDYLDFTHSYFFDEIYADMPVTKKKTKEEMDSFYKRFFDQSQTILADGGKLFLYSKEDGFVKKQIRLHPGMRLVKEFEITKKQGFSFYVIQWK